MDGREYQSDTVGLNSSLRSIGRVLSTVGGELWGITKLKLKVDLTGWCESQVGVHKSEDVVNDWSSEVAFISASEFCFADCSLSSSKRSGRGDEHWLSLSVDQLTVRVKEEGRWSLRDSSDGH